MISDRQRAINLIKQIKKNNTNALEYRFGCGDYGDDYCLSADGLIHVLTIFFNLTKEELK